MEPATVTTPPIAAQRAAPDGAAATSSSSPLLRVTAFLSNASVLLNTVSVSTRGIASRLKLGPGDIASEASGIGARLDDLHAALQRTRSPPQESVDVVSAVPAATDKAPQGCAAADGPAPSSSTTKSPPSILNEMCRLCVALHATPPPAVGTTATAVVADLQKLRRHGREVTMLVATELLAQLVDACKQVPEASIVSAPLSNGVPDLVVCLRLCLDGVLLEHYSLKQGIQPYTTSQADLDTALRQMLKVALDAVKSIIRCSALLQDNGRANDPPRTLSSWVSILDTMSLSVYFLVHTAAYEPAAGLTSAMAAAVAKSRSDAKSLIYQLIGLAVKQSPTQRCAAPSAVGWSPESLTAAFGTLSALHPLLDGLARCVVDVESPQSVLCLKALSDTLIGASTDDPAAIRWLVATPKYSKSIFTALLAGCIGSTSTVALTATLRAITTLLRVATIESRQELGFLHCNAMLRLLDSDNTATETRDAIVRHLASIAAQELSDSEVSSSSSADRPQQKRYLLVDLYAYLDLDPRLHHVNFIAQLITSLSRVARTRAGDLSINAVAQAAAATMPSASPSSSSTAVAAGSASFAAVTPKSDAPTLPSGDTESASNVAPLFGPTTLAHAALIALTKVTETMAFAAQQECLVAVPGPTLRWVQSTAMAPRDGGAATAAIQRIRAEKMALQRYVDIFNIKPEKLGSLWGLKMDYCGGLDVKLLTLPVNDPNNAATDESNDDARRVNAFAQSIADFLLHTPSLNPASIGEYLSDRFPVPMRSAYYFMSALQLRNRPVAAALAEMFLAVSLPKEGQKVERLLEAFANSYWDANKDCANTTAFPFKSSDATFVLIVATVMLHTDLHNPRVSSKMTKASFQAQLTRCNDDEDFPPGFAAEIFDTIAASPFNAAKGIGAAGMEGQAPNTTQIAQQSKMDFFFFSRDERKELMFTLERRRTFLETKELVLRRAVPLKQVPATQQVPGAFPPLAAKGFIVSQLGIPNLLKPPSSPATPGAADSVQSFDTAVTQQQQDPTFVGYSLVTKECFSATWGTMFAAFGVILQQESIQFAHAAASPSSAGTPSNAVAVAPQCLQSCVKGLKDLLFVAAVYGCGTEAEAVLNALVRVPRSSSVRQMALDSIFFVAASPFSCNLNASSWTIITHLCAETHFLASQGALLPSVAAGTLNGVYGAIELSLSPAVPSIEAVASEVASQHARAAVAIIHSRAEVLLQGVTTALTAGGHADVGAWTGILTVLRSLLKAFAMADVAQGSHVSIMNHIQDTLTAVFVTLYRWASSAPETCGVVSGALETATTMCVGVLAMRSANGGGASSADNEQKDPFDMIRECYSCILVTQPSGSPSSIAASGVLVGSLRVKGAVVRCLQRLCVVFGTPVDDDVAADPSAPRLTIHGRIVFASIGSENLFLRMLMPIMDAVMTSGTGPAEELRMLGTLALKDLCTTIDAIATTPSIASQPNRVPHSVFLLVRAGLICAIAAPTLETQAEGIRLVTTMASRFFALWIIEYLTSIRLDRESDLCEERIVSFTQLIILCYSVAARSVAIEVRHSTLQAAQWLVMQLTALARGSVPPCIATSSASGETTPPPPLLDGGQNTPPRRAISETEEGFGSPLGGVSTPSGSFTTTATSPLSKVKPVFSGLLVLLATRFGECAADAAAASSDRQELATEVATSVIDPLGSCAAALTVEIVMSKLAAPGVVSTSATFAQLLTFLTMDLFGAPTGTNRELPAKATPVPPTLPWQSAQTIASALLRVTFLPILRHATVTAKGSAAKALTRMLDRSLAAFGNSPAAHALSSSVEEAEFVLGTLADALSTVVMPPAYLAPFVKGDLSASGFADVFVTTAGGCVEASQDPASGQAETVTGSGRHIHIGAAEASEAYHALSCVASTLATYAANVAHRAAPLPETNAARRLVVSLLKCADDCIVLHERCPALASSLEFTALRNRPLYHPPPLVLHWTLAAAVRLLFSRWKHTAEQHHLQPSNIEEHWEERMLHAVTIKLFEFFAFVSKTAASSTSTSGGGGTPSRATGANRPGHPEAHGRGITHISSESQSSAAGSSNIGLRPPLAEVIREWGCMINAGDKGFAAATTSPVHSATSTHAPLPPQWRVLRRPDVFRVAVNALMVPDCPSKVVGAVAKYLTLFHSAELGALGPIPNAEVTLHPAELPCCVATAATAEQD